MLTKEQLWKLRQEIPWGSLFIKDYRNSFDINPTQVCDFFDGYMEWLRDDLAEENPNFTDAEFDAYLDAHDNADDLWVYYAYTFDYDPLRQVWNVTFYDDLDNAMRTIIVESLKDPEDLQEMWDLADDMGAASLDANLYPYDADLFYVPADYVIE